jgi:hypothetical protein
MNRLIGVAVALSLSLPLLAQETQTLDSAGGHAGITVDGTGDAKLPADLLEYRALLVKGGATPADAMVEYDRAVARLPKALDQLGLKGLTYELRGVVTSSLTEDQFRTRQRQAMNYGSQVPYKSEVKDYLTIRVPIEGLQPKDVRETVVAVLAAAMDLGLEDPVVRRQAYDPYNNMNLPSEIPEGWVAGITYTLSDPQKCYAAAVKNALEDAKAKAELQAGMVGARLGRVLSVETRSGNRVDPGRMRDLQHRVVLRVRYELITKN